MLYSAKLKGLALSALRKRLRDRAYASAGTYSGQNSASSCSSVDPPYSSDLGKVGRIRAGRKAAVKVVAHRSASGIDLRFCRKVKLCSMD